MNANLPKIGYIAGAGLVVAGFFDLVHSTKSGAKDYSNLFLMIGVGVLIASAIVQQKEKAQSVNS